MGIRGSEQRLLLVGQQQGEMKKLDRIQANYAKYSRPGMASKMAAMRLDTVFTSSSGNYLTHQVNGKDISVLDALGGFGANIFGHLHPQLVETLRSNLSEGVPFMAQMSVRPNTAQLTHTLDQMLPKGEANNWVSLILNTGADAVEAALKHAEMKRVKRLDAFQANLQKQFLRCRNGLQDGRFTLNSEFEQQLEEILEYNAPSVDKPGFASFLQDKITLLAGERPVSLALKRSYHGKSNGALHLTAGQKYRQYFVGLAHKTAFVDSEDERSLIDEITKATIQFPCFTVVDNQVHLVRQDFVNISALFAEPLQGEGGVHPISGAFLAECRRLSTKHKFQFVIDEIQSGMGRTGTFLYTEQLGVSADCYLLSKSLGGGIAKISAACFDERNYDPEFDEIHSSTFAEDDHSAAIAIEALTMLQTQPELMLAARQKGKALRSGLIRVMQQYPGVITGVRGEGLFIGVEFSSQIDSEFFVLRALGEHNLLGYVIVAYLLHEHRVRVATTMSDNFVLRIEPSFYISNSECDKIVSAIEMAAEILHKGNLYRLTRFMVGLESQSNSLPSESIESFRGSGNGRLNEPLANAPTVTFASNIIKAMHLIQLEPSLSAFTEQQLQHMCERVLPAIGPTTISMDTITSITGDKVNFKIDMIMYDPFYLNQAMRDRELAPVEHDLNRLLQNSIRQNCDVVGLGAYTSIVSRNGLKLVSDEICITTGNALTVGIGVRTMLSAAQTRQIDLSHATLGIVGAGGNIGSIYAQILADHVHRMILVGRTGRLQKLHRVAADIYCQVAQLGRQQSRQTDHSTNIITAILSTKSYQQLGNTELRSLDDKQRFYDSVNQELADQRPIKVVDDMSELAASNLILCASNAPDAVLFKEHIGDHQTIVCDVSVPEDVADSVHQCDNAFVISGGIVQLPRDPRLRWLGIDKLGEGASYACMAETMLLGLDGRKEHGSYGPISKDQVYEMLALADKHGFCLAQAKTGESVF